ncbi:Aspartate aminotransferase [Enhygromyxa salina]|uniref:Aminotransferase n=1 Tax=Enhygromyxa salina TaxID=215803 RepID=A0A0C2A137_9BACT|nr:aminotransferase class I/II-fold pyridoxal phosphate-dependent enzyme [Enhygromyxa salina]KIG17113.1 Aspartate aminotransferase [Enhygromyxa salina]
MKGRLRPLDYLVWAQSVPGEARWDLTASGVPDACGPASLHGREGAAPGPGWALGAELSLPELTRRDRRPDLVAAFLEVIGERYGVDPQCVVPTLGASQAITQVLFTLARPGDHVIVERPTFEPLHGVPETLGLNVSRLERKGEERWEPLADRLARLLTPKTRAVILSSLHNPSGVALETSTLVAIGEMAARVGALVLVDEVYLDFAFDASGETYPWQPACVAIENAVSWSSVTKAFGFAALRAGWVVARDRETAQAFRSASQYFHVDPPLASLALATEVMRHADELAAVAASAIAPARAVMDRWIASEARVGWVPPSAGQTGLVRLPDLTADLDFARHLRDRYGTQVVPGTMFEAPGSVRVSFNLPPEQLEQALATVSAALDDFDVRAVS